MIQSPDRYGKLRPTSNSIYNLGQQDTNVFVYYLHLLMQIVRGVFNSLLQIIRGVLHSLAAFCARGCTDHDIGPIDIAFTRIIADVLLVACQLKNSRCRIQNGTVDTTET